MRTTHEGRIARIALVGVIGIGLVIIPAGRPHAFTIEHHEGATGVLSSFLREGVFNDIEDEHEDWADLDLSPRPQIPWIHSDDCAFGETAAQINAFQSRAVETLTPGSQLDPWSAADQFGRSLHPIQDFYSHSNWVELGYPAGTTATARDLVDFGTRLAGSNGLGPWATPGPLGVVRGDIRSADFVTSQLVQSDAGFLVVRDVNGDHEINAADAAVADFPATWRVGLLPHPTQSGKAGFVPGADINGDGQFTALGTSGPVPVPVLRKGGDVRLLISAVGARPADSVFKNQCDPYERDSAGKRRAPLRINSCTNPYLFPDHYSCIAYHGSRFALTHDGSADSELRKDTSADAPTRFPKARALARLQTSYEWCRMINRAGLTRGGADGVLLALWVKEGASPHPANTPCARVAAKNPVGVRVTIDRVNILDDKDDDDDEPGEINLSLAAYDPPSSFHQSAKSKVGPLYASDNGDLSSTLSGSKVPASLRICPGSTGRFRVALHGWDDDEGLDFGAEPAANGDYNQHNGNPDDVLNGFTAEHTLAGVPGTGSLSVTRTSKDMSVTYRLTRTTGCP